MVMYESWRLFHETPEGNGVDRLPDVYHDFSESEFINWIREQAHSAAGLGTYTFGRPIKYKPIFAELAYWMLADYRIICTIRLVAATLGVSHMTLYRWARLYPDFCYALHAGKAVQEAWLATRLIHDWGNAQGILHCLYHLHGWRRNGRRSEDGQGSLREALEAQAAGARRVQWDRPSLSQQEAVNAGNPGT